MKETRRLAAEIGGKVGIDPLTALTILVAAAQGLIQLYRACRGENDTPEDLLRRLAMDRPRRLELRIHREARRQGLQDDEAYEFAAEFVRLARDKDNQPMFAALCREHIDDTGEWKAIT